MRRKGLERYNGAGEIQRLDTFTAHSIMESRTGRHKCGLLALFARRWIERSDGRVYIVLDICPDDVLGSLDHTGTLVQQRACCFAMWKHRHAAHDGLDGVRVDTREESERNRNERSEQHDEWADGFRVAPFLLWGQLRTFECYLGAGDD